MSLEENGTYLRAQLVAEKYDCSVGRGYHFYMKRNTDGKVVLEKTFPPDTPLDKACQDFNDSIAVWRKSSKAERMKERAEKNNKAAKDSEHSAAT